MCTDQTLIGLYIYHGELRTYKQAAAAVSTEKALPPAPPPPLQGRAGLWRRRSWLFRHLLSLVSWVEGELPGFHLMEPTLSGPRSPAKALGSVPSPLLRGRFSVHFKTSLQGSSKFCPSPHPHPSGTDLRTPLASQPRNPQPSDLWAPYLHYMARFRKFEPLEEKGKLAARQPQVGGYRALKEGRQ